MSKKIDSFCKNCNYDSFYKLPCQSLDYNLISNVDMLMIYSVLISIAVVKLFIKLYCLSDVLLF